MTHPAPTTTLDELRAALPADAVVTHPDRLLARAQDASATGPTGVPLAVVHPSSTIEVQAVARIAHRHGVPIVPQGALSGLAGGANAVDGALLMVFDRMAAVLRIDPVDQVAVVQPGVVTRDLAVAVAAQGLFYPPDPASDSWSTIGGNVATNAGGMRCVKYGVTRDFVRTLEVVLADGRVVRTSTPTVKAVAGYDLTGLVVGSEGTLAIVTEVTLGLLAAPGENQGICATFPTVRDALLASNEIIAGPHRPSTLELLDQVVLAAIVAHDPHAGLPVGARAMLLVLTDEHEQGAADVAAYQRIAHEHGALTVDVATDAVALEALLRARRSFHAAMRAIRGGSINEDVSVPRSRLPELLDRLEELSGRIGLPIGTGGHVGDGNLHPAIAYDPLDPVQVELAHRAHESILGLALELGGTVTGEHGIGLEKQGALDAELGPTVRELQRGLKAVFDPTGILNPGKKI
ncbi:FAD-binding oxidoreductase [Actinotalea sp. K2]|uniref:FAD-binding oxidoreductase n=1 Tax=Actinotalea sp. K2 TaxID=2939438 RepID=UPI002017F296|nr:FAD-linked oxidase C-terminal domain-containing protein [Actinotalea sp. K2]MCL3859596.1 FAD-binding protein [Actinotalea sp. K2]